MVINMDNKTKWVSLEEMLNNDQIYNDEDLIVFLDTEESMDFVFDQIRKGYPNIRNLQFNLRDKFQYQKIVDYLVKKNPESSIRVSAHFPSIYSLQEIAEIADERVMIQNSVNCYNVYDVDKKDRYKLNYFDNNRIYNPKEKQEYPIEVFLDQIDNLVDALNKNATSDIQKVFLLDKFYHDYFSYDKKRAKAQQSLDKKIAKYERKKNLFQFEKRRLAKLKNKRNSLSTDFHKAYYLLKNRKGVCSAFSELSYLILNHPQLNIKTKNIISEKEPHELNSIEIDGKEYVYDFTHARTRDIKKDSWFLINLEALYHNINLNIKQSKVYKKIKETPKTKITQIYFDNCARTLSKVKDAGIILCRIMMGNRFIKKPSTLTTGRHYYLENDDIIRKSDFSSYEQMPTKKMTEEITELGDKRIDIEEVTRKK